MSDAPANNMLSTLRLLLKPVAWFCARHSLHIQDMLEACKVVLIENCRDELKRKKEKVTISRLAAMTGMHRRDVMRIHREDDIKEKPQGVVNRIIGQWRQRKEFRTGAGRPRTLSCDGEESDFKRLVSSITSDIGPRAVLDELERVGAIERTQDGVKLVMKGYNPRRDIKTAFEMVSRDMQTLLAAVEGNLLTDGQAPNPHLNTYYDRVPEEFVPAIRQWMHKEAENMHQRARNYLAHFDRDINPVLDGEGEDVKVGVSCFGIISKDDLPYVKDMHKKSRKKKAG